MLKSMSFVAACLDFFGKKPGQSSVDFMQEIRQLTTEDRAELTKLLPSVGYEIKA